MGNLIENYYKKQNTGEKKAYSYDYSNGLPTGETLTSVATSVSPATGLTVAESNTTTTATVVVGTSSSAATYTITVTVTTTPTGYIDIFTITAETV
jgi:hypothetical protein